MMYFPVCFVYFLVLLSGTKGQGCPYSRTVVPGDAKRYIEIVHNVPYERHCAPGTEFDQLSCECSLTSNVPWSAGLAFMGGLKSAYPELAHMSLEALHKELSQLSSQTPNPFEVQPLPPFGSSNAPFNRNNGISSTNENTFNKFDLKHNVDILELLRPEEISPDVLSAIERVILLEGNPSAINSFPGQTNQFSPHVNQEQLLLTDSVLLQLLETDPHGSLPGVIPQVSNNFLPQRATTPLHKPAPNPITDINTHEIQQLIDSFQFGSKTTNRPTVNHNVLPVSRGKQSALDNFHSIANSILKAIPSAGNANIPKSNFQQNIMHPTTLRPHFQTPPSHRNFQSPTQHFSPHSTKLSHITNQQSQRHHREHKQQAAIAIPHARRQQQTKHNHGHTSQNRRQRPLPPRQMPQSNIDRKPHINDNINLNLNTLTQPRGIGIPVNNFVQNDLDKKAQSHQSKDTKSGKIQIPSTWKYFGPVDKRKRGFINDKEKTVEVSSLKLPNHWRHFQVSRMPNELEKENDNSKISDTKSVDILLKPTDETYTVSTNSRLTVTPSTPVTSKQDTTQSTTAPKEEMSATKLLKLIKKKLKQAKKTGNIPFSLLKMLLEKRQMLLKKLKEERKQQKEDEKQKSSQTETESKAETIEATTTAKVITQSATTTQHIIKSTTETTEKPMTTLKPTVKTILKDLTTQAAPTINAITSQPVPTIKDITTQATQTIQEITTQAAPTQKDTTTQAAPTIQTTIQDETSIQPTPTIPETFQSPTHVSKGHIRETIINIASTETSKLTDSKSFPNQVTNFEKSQNTANKQTQAEDTNTISSFSSGNPQVSQFGHESRTSKSKPRMSKPAEFRYDPFAFGAGLQNHDVLSLLAGSSKLDLFALGQPSPHEIPLNLDIGAPPPTVPDPRPVILPTQPPQTNFASRNVDPAPKMTSPLLGQDLATITAFLRERKEQRRLQSLANPEPKVSGFSSMNENVNLPSSPPVRTQKISQEKNIQTAINENIRRQQDSTSIRTDIKPQSNLPSSNSQGSTTSINMALEEKKTALLNKLMSKLTALEAKVAGNNPKQSSHGQNAMGPGSGTQGEQTGPNIGSVDQSPATQLGNSGLNSGPRGKLIHQSTNIKRTQSSGNGNVLMDQQMDPNSAYAMLFNSIAAKEGTADAHDIMQDKITELGGAAALALDPSLLNFEIRSQLSSTLQENSPFASLL